MFRGFFPHQSSRVQRHCLPEFRTRRISSSFQDKVLRIVLIGAPGSGKGTQATNIQQEFGLEKISTGDLLRNVPKGSPLAVEIEKRINSGGLVSDEQMYELVRKYIRRQDCTEKGWILDGYPRTANQAQQLDHLLEEIHQNITLVFYLKVNEAVIQDRLKDRWVHVPSGRVYNTFYKPPKVPGFDDVTGEPLVKRRDDDINTFRARLEAYHTSTEPLLNFYEKAGKLVTVDSPTSNEGFVLIKDNLQQLLKSYS